MRLLFPLLKKMNSAIMFSTHRKKENCKMRKYLTISVMTVFIVAAFFVVANEE
jgi:hypothetical protein